MENPDLQRSRAMQRLLTRISNNSKHVSHNGMPHESNPLNAIADIKRLHKLLQKEFCFFGRECLRLCKYWRSYLPIGEWTTDVYVTCCVLGSSQKDRRDGFSSHNGAYGSSNSEHMAQAVYLRYRRP